MKTVSYITIPGEHEAREVADLQARTMAKNTEGIVAKMSNRVNSAITILDEAKDMVTEAGKKLEDVTSDMEALQTQVSHHSVDVQAIKQEVGMTGGGSGGTEMSMKDRIASLETSVGNIQSDIDEALENLDAVKLGAVTSVNGVQPVNGAVTLPISGKGSSMTWSLSGTTLNITLTGNSGTITGVT